MKTTLRSRPLIGITPDLESNRSKSQSEPRTWLFQRYFRAIEVAGGLPVILPPLRAPTLIRETVARLNGLLLSGGDFDIHPKYYGEQPMAALGRLVPERTRFEWRVCDEALKVDLPILGICGGAQLINVILGGSLYQDIPTQLRRAVWHRAPTRQREHTVRLVAKSLLLAAVKRQRLIVNTTHHQSIKRLGRDLVVNAKSPDGIIEGIESRRHRFVVGLQWHPEALAPTDRCQQRILRSFIAAATQYRGRAL